MKSDDCLCRVSALRAVALCLMMCVADNVYSQASLPKEVDAALQTHDRFLQKVWIEYERSLSTKPELLIRERLVSESGKFLYRVDTTNEENNKKLTTNRSFDGHLYYQGTPTLKTPMVLRLLGDNPDDPKAKTVWIKASAFETVGIQLPTSARKCLDERIEPIVLFLNRVGTLESSEEAGDVFVLKFRVPAIDYLPARSITLSLSKQFNCAIVEWSEMLHTGQKMRHVKCSDFSQIEDSQYYLPRTVLGTVYVNDYHTETPEAVAEWTYALRLTTAGTLVSGVDFSQNGPIGSVVVERSSEDAKNAPSGQIEYQVPDSYENLSRFGRALYFRKWFLLGILLVAAVALWYIRKHKVR